MFFDVLLFCFLGIIVGIVCGLAPGIHPNLVAVFLLSFLPADTNTYPVIAFIVAVSVTNIIFNFIPTVLLGTPEPGGELSVLPCHRLLLAGQGYGAIKLCVIGAFGAILFSLLLLPLTALLIPKIYTAIKNSIFIILILLSVFFIMKENNKKSAFFIFCAGGALGVLAGRLPLDSNIVLFPLLTGLFGTSTLLLSLKNQAKIPEQNEELFVSRITINSSIVKGCFAGVLTGLLPGIGASSAAMLFSTKSAESFLVTTGAISSANMFFSFLALWLISKTRSGAAVVIEKFKNNLGVRDVVLITAIVLLSSALSVVISLGISKKFLYIMNKIEYSSLTKIVLVSVSFVVFWLTGLYGLFLLVLSTFLGFLPVLSGVKRIQLMAVLIVPVILFLFFVHF